MPPTLALIHDLAAALEEQDPERAFETCQALARRLGDVPAAVAIAQALAAEVESTALPPRLILPRVRGLVSCA